MLTYEELAFIVNRFQTRTGVRPVDIALTMDARITPQCMDIAAPCVGVPEGVAMCSQRFPGCCLSVFYIRPALLHPSCDGCFIALAGPLNGLLVAQAHFAQ